MRSATLDKYFHRYIRRIYYYTLDDFVNSLIRQIL